MAKENRKSASELICNNKMKNIVLKMLYLIQFKNQNPNQKYSINSIQTATVHIIIFYVKNI